MKITMYELLGLVKDDKELPKKIKVLDVIYEFDDHYGDYFNEPLNRYLFVYMTSEEEWKLAYFLNTEIEIIEEEKSFEEELRDNILKEIIKDLKEHKIPEKIKLSSHYGGTFVEEQKFRNKRDDEIARKINEILDYLEVNNG